MADEKKGRKSPTRRGRGEGFVEELPSGKFRAGFSAGVDPQTGKRKKITETFDTKREAVRWKAARIAERDRGELTNAGGRTIAKWLDEWLEDRKTRVAKKTYEHDAARVKNHLKPRIGRHALERLTPAHIRKMLADMDADGKSASERQKAGKVLREALNVAVTDGLIPNNPATKVKLPKPRPTEKTVLDADQVRRLAEVATNSRFGAWMVLALDTGMRPGELFGLHWQDVELDGLIIHVRRSLEETSRGELTLKDCKTERSRRSLPIAPMTGLALHRLRQALWAADFDVEEGLVFPDSQGGFMRQGNFARRHFRPILQAAEIPNIRPYDCRHTCATLLLAAGVNVRVVSEDSAMTTS